MKIRPVASGVLVERTKAKEISDGGIILPGANKQTAMNKGRVHAVGPDVKCFNVGEVVLFGEFDGVPVSDNAVILQENEIIAIVLADVDEE